MGRKRRSRKPGFGFAADLGYFAKQLGEFGIRRKPQKLTSGLVKMGIKQWLGGGTRKQRKSTRGQERPLVLANGGVSLVIVSIFAIFIIVELSSNQHSNAAILVGIVAVVLGYYACRFINFTQHSHKVLAIEFFQIDVMTGHDFERYIGELLRLRGYQTQVTRGSGDNGVDVIAASKDGDRWAIQCKRQAANVPRNAISDAVAATNSTMFNCNRAMVITNQYFTYAAIEYAKSTNCVLVDRDVLSTWIQSERLANGLAESGSHIDS